MFLSFTESGHIFVSRSRYGGACKYMRRLSGDDVIDIILRSGYSEEFIISDDFDEDFVSSLMSAGFLIMSCEYVEDEKKVCLLLPKHHITRSVLQFGDLHIGRTVKRLLGKYTLRADADFDEIVENCIRVHGEDWLTKPLVSCIKNLRSMKGACTHPASFALYKDGRLIAGEFGIITGRVYTSYSGYKTENSSGRVQMILTALYLQENNFAFWDLGMPLDYKYTLGAKDISIRDFVPLFRGARGCAV